MESMDIIDYLNDVQYFRLFPIVWIDECAELDRENADKIKRMILTPLTASEVVQWLLVALGAIGLMISTITLLKSRNYVQP